MKKRWYIRRSMVPKKEPNWFHDYETWGDGSWQLAFFGWILIVNNRRK